MRCCKKLGLFDGSPEWGLCAFCELLIPKGAAKKVVLQEVGAFCVKSNVTS